MSSPAVAALPSWNPKVLDRGQGSASLGGATMSLYDSGRVSGASVSQAANGRAPVAIELCDGSQFTFSRLVDLRTSSDA